MVEKGRQDTDATSLQRTYNLAGQTKQKALTLKNALPTHTPEILGFMDP